MAEGLLGGVLGEEDEKPDVEAAGTLPGAEAFAAAVAARLSASDPEVAKKTAAFLEEQAHLVKVQAKHLEDEHAARLHYLQGQAREVDIRRFGLRLRVGFQLFIVFLATAIGIAVIVMIHDAVTSRRVVMEPFHAPPGLAARGIDGVVVASGLLDELSHLQDATRSAFAARVLSGAWTSNSKLDVPETGVSIGEISRLLGIGSVMTSTSTATWLKPRTGTLRSRSAATACRREPSGPRPRSSERSQSMRLNTFTHSPSRRAGPRI